MSPRFAMAWGLAAFLGCGAADGGRLPPAAIGHTAEDATPPPESKEPIALELAHSSERLLGGVSGARNLGMDLSYITTLGALEAVAGSPEWSADSQDPELARDDDLLTAWTCTPTSEARCAIGLMFPEPVELHSIRIYAAAGPDWKAYNAHPRLLTVRLHTDAGSDAGQLDDGAGHRYLFLGQPVKTKSVTIEVVSTRGGNAGPIHVNEIEAYGVGGVARPPIELDPDRTYVNYVNSDWKQYESGEYVVRQAFLEVDRPGGDPVRFMRGTAMYGAPGDRFVLIERMHKTSCDFNSGSYVALDTQRRTYFPLGPLGGVPGVVFRNADGLGFAIGHGDLRDLRGNTFNGKAFEAREFPKNARDQPTEYMDAWGMRPPALSRGAPTWDTPPANCSEASDTERRLVGEHLGVSGDEEMLHCNLASGGAVIAQSGVAVVDDAGGVVASREFPPSGTYPLRLRTAGLEDDSDVEMYIETRANDGAGRVIRVHAGGIAPLEEDTSLALRPPHGCKRANGFGTRRSPATASDDSSDDDDD